MLLKKKRTFEGTESKLMNSRGLEGPSIWIKLCVKPTLLNHIEHLTHIGKRIFIITSKIISFHVKKQKKKRSDLERIHITTMKLLLVAL